MKPYAAKEGEEGEMQAGHPGQQSDEQMVAAGGWKRREGAPPIGVVESAGC